MKKIIQTILLSTAMVAIPIMGTSLQANTVQAKESCGGVETAILSCGGSKDAKDIEGTGIWAILILVLNIMTGMVALAAVGGIAYAAILYASAEDKSAQVQQAKEKIFGVVVGLVLFAGMYAILQFLIPGGIF
jgi:uncharacterized membrane protein